MRVAITFGGDRRWVRVREPSGHDELVVREPDTATALELLDRVIEQPAPATAADLVAADRDRVLAAVYELVYGPRIDSTVVCAGCRQPFDLDFALRDLVDSARPEPTAAVAGNEDGTFTMADGRRFRLPTGHDELALLARDADDGALELLRHCVVAGSAADDPAGVADAMARVAPLLDRDIDARCPECGRTQTVHFDLQHYVLTRLANDRGRLLHDVHRLASAYHWPLTAIMALPRSQRRAYVALVEQEHAGR